MVVIGRSIDVDWPLLLYPKEHKCKVSVKLSKPFVTMSVKVAVQIKFFTELPVQIIKKKKKKVHTGNIK